MLAPLALGIGGGGGFRDHAVDTSPGPTDTFGHRISRTEVPIWPNSQPRAFDGGAPCPTLIPSLLPVHIQPSTTFFGVSNELVKGIILSKGSVLWKFREDFLSFTTM